MEWNGVLALILDTPSYHHGPFEDGGVQARVH
jgi:hypothetical protein